METELEPQSCYDVCMCLCATLYTYAAYLHVCCCLEVGEAGEAGGLKSTGKAKGFAGTSKNHQKTKYKNKIKQTKNDLK